MLEKEEEEEEGKREEAQSGEPQKKLCTFSLQLYPRPHLSLNGSFVLALYVLLRIVFIHGPVCSMQCVQSSVCFVCILLMRSKIALCICLLCFMHRHPPFLSHSFCFSLSLSLSLHVSLLLLSSLGHKRIIDPKMHLDTLGRMEGGVAMRKEEVKEQVKFCNPSSRNTDSAKPASRMRHAASSNSVH